MIPPIAAISLQIGIKDADFSGTRRARMIRQEWSLIGFIIGAIVGAAVFAPVLAPYLLSLVFGSSISTLN